MTAPAIIVICSECERNGYPRVQGLYRSWDMAEQRAASHLMKVGPKHTAFAADLAQQPSLANADELSPYRRGGRR